MDANAYELLSLCMRYVFAALMVLILLRAWKITMVDWRRSAKLRRLSPETGIIGEFLVIDGHERCKNGMRYPVILEGSIGSDKRNDIRLRSRSVRRRHALFQMTSDGLFIRGHARCRVRDGFGRVKREMTMHDGDFIIIGEVRLMLVLSGAENRYESSAQHSEHDSFEHESFGPEFPETTGERTEVLPGISRDNRDNDDFFNVDDEFTQTDHTARRRYNPGKPEFRHRNKPDDDDDVFYDFDEYDDC